MAKRRGSSRPVPIGCLGLSIALAMVIGCSAGESVPAADAEAAPAVAEAIAGEPADQAQDAFEDDELAAEESATASELETLAACNSSPASFAVNPASAVGGPMIGFGAQFNANLFHPKGRFNQSKLGALTAGLRELRPQHVRIFFSSKAFRDPALMESFSRTVALAQSTGATINATWWHGPYQGAPGTPEFGRADMQAFADVLKREIVDRGHTAIQYVTVQNEPNRTKFNSHKRDMVTLYKTLHAELVKRGIRNRVKVVFELTRGHQGTKSWYKDWLKDLGPDLAGVIDGWAFHIYQFHFWNDGLRLDRLRQIRDAIRSLPAAARKPVYVSEQGTRGHADTNKSILRWPGFVKKNCSRGRRGCTLITDSTVGAVSNAWFMIAASRLGFRGFVNWDAYWTMYDKADQQWSMITSPAQGMRRRPTFYVGKLFSNVVPVGWVPVSVSDPGRQALTATAFKGRLLDGDGLVVIGVNRSECGTKFRYSGLPAGKKFFEVVWNDDGGGRLCSRGLKTAVGGRISVAMKKRSAVALTTRAHGMSLPSCSVGTTAVPPGACGDGECTDGETDANCGQDCGCGADACGTVAPFGCFCDADCAADGDCCADVEEVCQ